MYFQSICEFFQLESPFAMKKPEDLVTFMRQQSMDVHLKVETLCKVRACSNRIVHKNFYM